MKGLVGRLKRRWESRHLDELGNMSEARKTHLWKMRVLSRAARPAVNLPWWFQFVPPIVTASLAALRLKFL